MPVGKAALSPPGSLMRLMRVGQEFRVQQALRLLGAEQMPTYPVAGHVRLWASN